MGDNKGGRLQSLKLPRDLSLGLTKAKKQYMPNVNVVRNKQKPKEILKKNDEKRRERTNNKVKREKQDHQSQYYQQTGIFSQGGAEMQRPGLHSDRRVGYRDGTSNSSVSNMALPMPTISKNSGTFNQKSEDAVLDRLTNCDIDSDDEKPSFMPLTLDRHAPKNVKKELPIKKEDDDLRSCAPEPFNSDIYSEENPCLGLVQLPDSFAGKGLSDDPNVKKLFDYPLSGMLEGQIGKLIIRKSGKMEVYIGNVKYDFHSESTYDGREELATIAQNENGEHYIARLGNVNHNFIMCPDFESLLKKSKK